MCPLTREVVAQRERGSRAAGPGVSFASAVAFRAWLGGLDLQPADADVYHPLDRARLLPVSASGVRAGGSGDPSGTPGLLGNGCYTGRCGNGSCDRELLMHRHIDVGPAVLASGRRRSRFGSPFRRLRSDRRPRDGRGVEHTALRPGHLPYRERELYDPGQRCRDRLRWEAVGRCGLAHHGPSGLKGRACRVRGRLREAAAQRLDALERAGQPWPDTQRTAVVRRAAPRQAVEVVRHPHTTPGSSGGAAG